MFESVLIANRGEIACRVMRTCRRLGVRTVAVFSEADRGALFTRMADAAVEIGAAPARESYLRMERILEAARQHGAGAIHPGYGFLSENPAFARACAAAGIAFIGPTPEAIEAMGLKDAAKALMQRAGVPVVPGYHGSDQSDARLLAEAKTIGFPVLIKAVAGGGGKGMRAVHEAGGFQAALDGARREAESAFGDSRVLIEKYLAKPRHIEVQILADTHGTTLALHERDCSLQRRHQKLVEEAPAPGVTPDLRAHLAQLACAAARAVNYTNAGTIEMIVDASQALRPQGFYFMEMNTRLQVEHPVTEMITGLDLVEWQLRVAAGERLPFKQAELAPHGHAIEVRICAEDALADDAPRTGRLVHVAFPNEPQLRVETGVQSGDQVTPFYDSMLAKLVVWGENRESAIRRMQRSLEQVTLAGVVTNVPFLASALSQPEFCSGDVNTGLLELRRELINAPIHGLLRALPLCAVVGRICAREQQAQQRDAVDPFSPWREPRGFRLNAPAHEELTLRTAGSELRVQVTHERDSWRIGVRGAEPNVISQPRLVAGELSFLCDGRRQRAHYFAEPVAGVEARGSAREQNGDERVFVCLLGASAEFAFGEARRDAEDAAAASGAIRSPLPGRILSVFAAREARVKRGQPLVSMEAMKMEHTLHASVDGVVTELHVRPGDQVAEGSTLLVLQAAEE